MSAEPTPVDTELEAIRAGGLGTYELVRRLDDGSVAVLARFIFTWGILLDCTMTGYGQRYCFSGPDMARKQFNALKTADDEPMGYTRRLWQ